MTSASTPIASQSASSRPRSAAPPPPSLAQWVPPPPSQGRRRRRSPARGSTTGSVVISGAGANVVAMSGPDGALLVDGGLEARSGELLKLALKETWREACAHADQHALAPGADGLERAAGQGGREDHRARKHQTVAWLQRTRCRCTDTKLRAAAAEGAAQRHDVRFRQPRFRRAEGASTATCSRRTRMAISTCSCRTRTCSSRAARCRTRAGRSSTTRPAAGSAG